MKDKLRYLRCYNNGLQAPFSSITNCVSTLLGIQSQILNAAFMSIFSRTKGTTEAALHQHIHQDKSLLGAWGQRATLHLYSSRDWATLVASHQNRRSWFERNFSAQGKDYQQLRKDLDIALADKTRFTRNDLKGISEKFGEEALTSWGGVLISLSFEGLICNLGKSGSLTAYGYTPNWLGEGFKPSELSETAANIHLLENYFKAYAPATFDDFCHWRGASKTKAKAWLEAAMPNLREWESGYFVHKDLFDKLPQIPENQSFTHLLYRFDPLLLAYHDKTWLADKTHHKKIWQKAAHVNPVVLQNEGVTAIWNYKKEGKKELSFVFDTLRPYTAAEKENIAQEAEKIAAFWDRKVGKLEISS